MRGLRVKGARTNAQGLDLNRDYARLQSPEIAAVVALLRRFDPALYIDVHVSDGTDYQYDITYTFAGWGSYTRSRVTAGWLKNDYSTDVDAALTAQGHVPGVYPSWIEKDQPARGLRISAEGPRYSTGYDDFAGIPTVLVENDTMKPYKRRVLGTYVLLEQSIRTVARERERIARAKAEDRAARPARLMVGGERDPEPLATREFEGYRCDRYDLKASGTSELRWTGESVVIGLPVYGVRSTREIEFPRAWWIRPEQTGMIATLRALAAALLAPLADRMMENDPALRERFAQALAGDRALATDPQARLRWWLERSDYFERSLFTYPVFRESSAAACRFTGR